MSFEHRYLENKHVNSKQARQFWQIGSSVNSNKHAKIYYDTKKLRTLEKFSKRSTSIKLSIISSSNDFSSNKLPPFIVPTPLEGGGAIYSNGFFLFRQFWSIDILIVGSCAWYH